MIFFSFIVNFSFAKTNKIKEKNLDELSLQKLMELKVTIATKTDRNAKEVPASVRVFTRDDIERNQWEYLSELLNSVDGMLTVDCGMYSISNVRGIPDVSGTGNRLLLMVDGVNYNLKLNGAWFDYNLDIAEKVEVVLGPASCLYGADAFQGIINIITKQDEIKEETKISVSAGSFNTYLGNFLMRKNIGDVSFSLNLKSMNSDGFSLTDRIAGPNQNFFNDENSFEKPSSAYLRFSYKKISAYYNYYNHHYGYRSYILFPLKSSWNYKFNNYGISYDTEIGEYLTSSTKFYGASNQAVPENWIMSIRDGLSAYVTAGEQYYGGEQMFQYKNTEFADITLGVQYEYFKISDFKRSWNKLTHELLAPIELTNTAFYLQVEKNIIEELYIIGGIRYDYNSKFGGIVNPRGGVVYSLTDTMNLKFLYAEAFRAPEMYEMFTTDSTINMIQNPDLKPERLKTYEITLNGFITDSLWAETTLYFYKIWDIITASNPIIDGVVYAQYLNAGNGKTRGINTRLIYDTGSTKFSIAGNYHISKGKEGEPLVNTNKYSIISSIELNPINELFITLRGFNYGDFYLPETNRYYPDKLKGFTRFDLTIFKKNFLTEGLDLSLRFDNLTDADGGFPGARGGSGYFPGRHIFTSRAFYFKVSYNFIR